MIKNFKTFDTRIAFNEKKSTSKAMTNNYAEIGSPWRTHFSQIKQYVVFPTFKTQDSCLLVMVSTHLINVFPETVFFKDLNLKSMV